MKKVLTFVDKWIIIQLLNSKKFILISIRNKTINLKIKYERRRKTCHYRL